MIYLFLFYSFYIINFSFIIKSDCTTITENIEERLEQLKQLKLSENQNKNYFNSIECSIDRCDSGLINENICYTKNQIRSIYGFDNITGCYIDGDEDPKTCDNSILKCPYRLTELDSDGKWLGYLRCTRDYIDINDIDENVDEKRKNPHTQYKYDFKFNFLSEPDKKSTKTGTVQSQFLKPFEDTQNYNDLLIYYYSQCINGYYEKSCNYLFNYCVIAMYNKKNGICEMILNLDSNLRNE